jgi:endonuclease/exonuclease/phosphatase family metal-dependent hydrolase
MSINQFPYGPHLGDLRILTLNLWQTYGAWADRRSVLIKGLRAVDPDLVAFQESIKTNDYDQVIDLLGPGFNVVHQKARDPNGMGISIASRWPLGEVQDVDLQVTPRTEGFPAGALIVQVFAPNPIGPMIFVNHFPNWQLNFERERELQALAAARLIEYRARQTNQQVVMAGDLDADPDSSSIRFWSGRQSLGDISICYRDAWESTHPKDRQEEDSGHTFTPHNPLVKEQVVRDTRPFRDWPFRRIDYIFVRFGEHGGGAFDIKACGRFFDEPVDNVWASDHFGLIADLAHPRG